MAIYLLYWLNYLLSSLTCPSTIPEAGGFTKSHNMRGGARRRLSLVRIIAGEVLALGVGFPNVGTPCLA